MNFCSIFVWEHFSFSFFPGLANLIPGRMKDLIFLLLKDRGQRKTKINHSGIFPLLPNHNRKVSIRKTWFFIYERLFLLFERLQFLT